MKRYLALLMLLTAAITARAATFTVNASQSTAAIQSVINGTSIGDTVSFLAGTYSLTAQLNLKCGVTYTGPVATPATAEIAASAANMSLLKMTGGCTSGTTTIQYLDFNGGGPAYFDASNYSNINFLHNQVTNMPYSSICSGPCTSLYFDGSNSNTDSNITIEYNTFGDGNTCVAGEKIDEGGCAGILTATVGFLVNFTVKYNSFIHLNEGMHFQNTNFCSGCTSAVGENLDIEYNYFNQINRIPLENQVGDILSPQIMSNNVVGNNNTTGVPFATIAISSACCFNGRNFSVRSDQNPTNYVQNNLVFQSIGNATTLAAPLALEIAGVNPQTTNNAVQGFYCYGATWSWSGSAGGTINNNTFQSPIMASGGSNSQCNGGPGSYLSSECSTFCGTPPSFVGNTLGSTPSAITSAAPTISPASGSRTFPLTVTLTDPGYTSGAVPLANTGIWYTIDGSTPTPGSGTAQRLDSGGTITLSSAATVKAVGMWGAQNQPTSYPSGFGFVPSAVQSAVYSASGGVTLSSVSIAPTAGVSTLSIGSTVQMIVTCHYSDGSTTGCNTTDSRGSSVTSWASSNGNVSVSGTGLATGAGLGTSVVTAVVTGGFTTSPGSTLTVNASPLTLSSVSLAAAGGVTSINAGATNQLITTCHYSDGTTNPCNTVDSHGNQVSSFNSSAPTIATVTSGGLVTGVAAGSTNLTGSVIPSPSMLGTSLENVTGFTNNGFINEIYGVTGSSASGYTPGNCHITIPATTNWTAGKLWTCLLVLGTPTTQNPSALCSNSFTLTGTSWPGGDIVISMASCPSLPPDQGYWVGSTTNQATSNPTQGFSNCNSSCSGGAPLVGSGTYAYKYVPNPFGSYTSLPTTLSTNPPPGQQVSQYIELTTTAVTSGNLTLGVNAPPPTLVSAYITGASSLVVPNTAQMAAKCHYTSGPDQDCTVADIYGDAVTAWTSSDATKATVGAVGSSNPGLVTAVAAGTPSITAVVNTGVNSTAFPITVSSPAVTLTGVSLSLTGGVTGLFVGATNQLKATCTYSDRSSDDCTTSDAHGNLAHSYLSSAPGHATVNTTSGLVTGVAPGSTTFTAVAGSFTSNPLPLAVFPVLSGIYTITVSGPVKFSGTVHF